MKLITCFSLYNKAFSDLVMKSNASDDCGQNDRAQFARPLAYLHTAHDFSIKHLFRLSQQNLRSSNALCNQINQHHKQESFWGAQPPKTIALAVRFTVY